MTTALAAKRELARRELDRRAALEHPANLLKFVSMPDERTAETFTFQLTNPCENPANEHHEGCCWYWQRHLLDSWLDSPRAIVLKARQLGVTWLAGGLGLWQALYKPGSLVLVYRQKEADAGVIVERIWDMFQSLPPHLLNGAKVVTPAKGHRPSNKIELVFPDGKLSRIQGQASTSSAGHGETAALIIMDEFARIDAASDLMRAVQPAAGEKGKIILVSTANGRSNEETGDGNYFHYLWYNGQKYEKQFLAWWLHPDRDQDWYDNSPETVDLRWWERQEQYPNTPSEAFALPSKGWFDPDSLNYYASEAVSQPLERFDFEKTSASTARRRKDATGLISVYEYPKENTRYAIGADVATGRGRDFSAAYVVDLTSMTICAEVHGRIDPDLFAYQLHYLGRWYNTAKIAVEKGGGYGEPVIINLRDGKDGRPPYPDLYRYREWSNTKLPIRDSYGYPMTSVTRPQVINAAGAAIRDKSLPSMPAGLLDECGTFVRHDTNPSPRALDGMHDDRVMAFCITLEMYRQFGYHPDKRRPARLKSSYKHWLPLGN